MIDDRLDRRPTVLHTTSRARKIDNERFLTRSTQPATQRRTRKRRQRENSNTLGNSGSVALEHGARGLRGDVSCAQPGTTSRQHEIGTVGVAPGGEVVHDVYRLVGDELALRDLVSAI